MPNRHSLSFFVWCIVPEVQQRCGVGHLLLQKVDAHEFAKGIAVIDGVFNALIRQREPALQQIHPQHFSIPFGGQPRLPLK